MAETVIEQEGGTGTPDNTQDNNARTFTQEEVNKILNERLGRERAKYTDYETLKDKAAKFDAAEEANKTELQKATELAAKLQKQVDDFTKANELRTIRDKIAQETGVPAALLTGSTEEECKTQAAGILAFAKPDAYPEVRDGGEPQHNNKKSTTDQFAEWFAQSMK